MNEQTYVCIYLIDTHGLRAIALTRSNSLKAHCLDLLQKGIIAVPNCVWDEFAEAYDDEAASMIGSIANKIPMNRKYNNGAAKIADQLNSGFSLSPYDSTTDFFAAAIAITEGYTLVTASDQVGFYAKVKSCDAIDVAALVLQ